MTTPTLISPTDLEQHINTLLNATAFNDYCPNGLQVDGGQAIHKIITGVTACEALIDKAIERNAQAILVHHGYFWKGEPAPLTGMKGKRVRKLMQHGISLLAYHLPLDSHPTLGNNAQLAQALGLTLSAPLYPEEKNPVGNIAILETPISALTLYQRIITALQREPLYISSTYNDKGESVPTDTKLYYKIGICTGGAEDMIEQAFSQGCDAYISGEISERTTHIVRELGIDYFSAGHHATEKGGIMALGEELKDSLKLDISFIDIKNLV